MNTISLEQIKNMKSILIKGINDYSVKFEDNLIEYEYSMSCSSCTGGCTNCSGTCEGAMKS